MNTTLSNSWLFRKSQLEWTDVIDFIEAQKRKQDMKDIEDKLDKGMNKIFYAKQIFDFRY